MKTQIATLLLGISFFSSILLGQEPLKLMADYLDSIEKYQEGMGSFAISEKGKVKFEKHFGYANLATNTLANSKTKYRIGSISKTFTAVCVLQMVQEGKLDLEEPISNYFPTLPNAEFITISQLLHHRSGLHNFTDDDDFLDYMSTEQTRNEQINRFIQKGVDFDPGEQYAYSNTNYVLLGYICEEIDHLPFAKIIQKRITKPLKLKNTYHASTYQTEKQEALSYYWDKEWLDAYKTNGSVSLGAGSIVSTVVELNKFLYALETGKLLNLNTLATMKTMVDNYGCGLFPLPWKNSDGIGHTGGIDGFQSVFFHLKEQNIYVSFCGNALRTDRDAMVNTLLELYFGEATALPDVGKKVEVNPEVLVQYEGVYSNDQLGLEIDIAVESEQLTAQATGQGRFPLTPKSETTFVFDLAGLQIIFHPDKNSFVLYQAGGEFLFEKEQKKETAE